MDKSNEKWLFAVVMSVYNVAPYIREAIDSLIAQDIGFEENIQLILVNDGSTDESGEICKEYKDRYSDNVVYIQKENGGPASARNVGLPYVDAKYVNFMDPDDTMTPNAFSEVRDFFELHRSNIHRVCVPAYCFEKGTGIDENYRRFGDKNKIINIVKEPEKFVLSVATSFYRNEFIREMLFDENLIIEGDVKFNHTFSHKTKLIGYVCRNGARYNYRLRYDNSNLSAKILNDKPFETILEPISLYEDILSEKEELGSFEKELIAYELRNCLEKIRREGIKKNDYEKIINSYNKWISKLDMEFVSHSKYLNLISYKILFLQISGRSFGQFIRGGHFDLSDCMIATRLVEYIDGCFWVTLSYNNFGDNNIEICLISEKTWEIQKADIGNDLESTYDVKCGEFTTDITHIRKFRIERIESEYKIYFLDKITENLYPVKRNRINPKGRYVLDKLGVGPVYDGYCLSISGGVVSVRDVSKESYSINALVENDAGYKLTARLYQGTKKWILISDRPEKAGDNGEALFYYIMRNETADIRGRTYYVINTSCADYERMLYKDHIIEFRSEEHIQKYINACIIYSSHNAVQFFYPFEISQYRNYADLLKSKFVWLQHGVIENDVAKTANRYATQDDAVVVSTRWEKSEFSSERYFFDGINVLPTGLARWDELERNKRKTIILAPTWRNCLVGGILPNGHNEPKLGFAESAYYKTFISLLESSKLRKLLRSRGYQLDFVLHSGFSCYEALFEGIECDCIHLKRMDNFSYRDEISRCGLFITDYSSTAFDAAYIGKPIIYFQFDEEDFFEKHYKRSTWSYRENGFGPVVTGADDLMAEICRYLDNGCEPDEKYKTRADDAFFYRDRNNCRRIMDATRKWCEPVNEEEYSVERLTYGNNELKDTLYHCNDEIARLKRELDKERESSGYAWYCLDETRKSVSYRAGLWLTALPRMLREHNKSNRNT